MPAIRDIKTNFSVFIVWRDEFYKWTFIKRFKIQIVFFKLFSGKECTIKKLKKKFGCLKKTAIFTFYNLPS